jgi:hypothetical protein
MIGASVLLVVHLVAQPAPSPDPGSLVKLLGSDRYAQREAAARALEQLAAAALPALRAGRESRDLEIRTRATAVLHKVEGSLLTQPTMVWLNFEDSGLPEIVRTLSQRTGMKIALFPENLPRWKSEKITLRESQPLPFWKAIDRLCAGAELQNDLELHGFASSAEPTLALTDRITRPFHPVSDHGPFRVSLVGLEYQRHVGFAIVAPQPRGNRRGRPGPNPAGAMPPLPQPRAVTSDQCSIQLQITAEPRLGVSQDGPLQLLEARDDQGNNLVTSDLARTLLTDPAGYLGGTCSSVVHIRAPLARPERAGKTIKTLRGVVPLRITAREPDPLVVPLAVAAGKSFDKGDIHLAVHEVRADPNTQQRQIELSIGVRESSLPASENHSGADPAPRQDPHQQSIQVLDSHGQVLPWIQTSTDMESARITVTMAGKPGAEPSELRYYHMTETSLDVPFAFRDIPMP